MLLCYCFIVGQVPREAITPRNVPFPNFGSHASESYQLDKSTGNTSMFISYSHIHESFYVAAVVCDVLARIWLVLPEPDSNMFRTVPSIRQLANCPPTLKRPGVRDQIMDILGDFEAFITAQLKHLSEQQVYQLETTKTVLFIHSHFLKEELDNAEAMCYVSALRSLYLHVDEYQIVTRIPSYTQKSNHPPTLDRSVIPDSVMAVVVPQAIELIERTSQFLEKRETNQDLLQKAPSWLIVDALETSSLVLMLHIQQEDNVSQAIHYLDCILKMLRLLNLYSFPEEVRKLKNNIKQFIAHWAPQTAVVLEERSNDRIPTAEIRSFYPTPPPTSYENLVQLMSMSTDPTDTFDTETIATDEGFVSSPLSFANFTETPEEFGQYEQSHNNDMQQDLLNIPTSFLDTPFPNDSMSTEDPSSHFQQSSSSPLVGDLEDLANIDASNLAMDFNLSEYDTNMLQQHINNLNELQEIPLDLFVLDEQT